MIDITDIRGMKEAALVNLHAETTDHKEQERIEQEVNQIIEDVKKRGDEALKEYTLRFDGVKLERFQIPTQEIKAAWDSLDKDFCQTLTMAAENIQRFHRQQIRQGFILTDQAGVVMGQRYTPIEKVGICVPRSPSAFPSTILMNVIPARLAGVQDIILVVSPDTDGSINPEALGAAYIADKITADIYNKAEPIKIFTIGGAQAVAALAWGTESIPAVDKIVGPGGIYVSSAKRQVFGKVAIDMIAGPSEILVLADGASNPIFIAADMLSQAEHDTHAAAILITDSQPLAEAVQQELERQLIKLPRQEIARASLERNGKIILTDNLEMAIDAANAVAPEHLELCVSDPFALLPKVRNAGSIFLGRNAPEALGDYFAGPNHTLPTSGAARFSSPLSVDDFVKKSSFLYYTSSALEDVAERIADFAECEGLHAHAQSVLVRKQNKKNKK